MSAPLSTRLSSPFRDASLSNYVEAGPKDSKPTYSAIDSAPLNRLLTKYFRAKMVKHLQEDSELDGFDAVLELTRKLNTRYGSPLETQLASQKILHSLFPAWLLPAFRVMFSRPFPAFSCRLNAWVTASACQWLMGRCEVNDAELASGAAGASQGVLVERCRYLEESGCASICLNSCKIPTQSFFAEHMALPLTMTPNYEDFSCQFSFGVVPPPPDRDEAFATPCFSQCPSKKPHRSRRQCAGAES